MNNEGRKMYKILSSSPFPIWYLAGKLKLHSMRITSLKLEDGIGMGGSP
jgi:hypothetical protein